jgi:hypothetical protein
MKYKVGMASSEIMLTPRFMTIHCCVHKSLQGDIHVSKHNTKCLSVCPYKGKTVD